MYNSRFFKRFCKQRNVRGSTVTGYLSSIKKYEKFHKKPIDTLIHEAIDEENNMISTGKAKVEAYNPTEQCMHR